MNQHIKSLYPWARNYDEGGPKKKVPTSEQLAVMVNAQRNAELNGISPMSKDYNGLKIVQTDKTKTASKIPPKVEPLTEEELKDDPGAYVKAKSKYITGPSPILNPNAAKRDLEIAAQSVAGGKKYWIDPIAKQIFGMSDYEAQKALRTDPLWLYQNAINQYNERTNFDNRRREFYQNNLAEYANNLFDTSHPILNGIYKKFYGKNLKPFDETQNGLLNQFGRWYSRKYLTPKDVTMTSNNGADIVSLNENVIRMTPTSRQATGLFNEFVERRNPSVYKVANLKSGKVKTLSDNNIPLDNISLYAGIENGHYKVDKLENFDDNTTVYPVRNIKQKYSAPIRNISVQKNGKDNYYETALIDPNDFENSHLDYFTKLAKERFENDLNIQFALKGSDTRFGQDTRHSPPKLNGKVLIGGNDTHDGKYITYSEFKKKYPEIYDQWFQYDAFSSPYSFLYPTMFKKYEGSSKNQYTVTDVNGITYPISNLNAAILDNKMVWGNPNGGVFIGSFKDMNDAQIDSLNTYLQNNPSWLVRPDLGSFDTYRLDNPSLDEYLQQYFEHPKSTDPNVFTVGTTTPNRIWASAHAKGGPIKRLNLLAGMKTPEQVAAETMSVAKSTKTQSAIDATEQRLQANKTQKERTQQQLSQQNVEIKPQNENLLHYASTNPLTQQITSLGYINEQNPQTWYRPGYDYQQQYFSPETREQAKNDMSNFTSLLFGATFPEMLPFLAAYSGNELFNDDEQSKQDINTAINTAGFFIGGTHSVRDLFNRGKNVAKNTVEQVKLAKNFKPRQIVQEGDFVFEPFRGQNENLIGSVFYNKRDLQHKSGSKYGQKTILGRSLERVLRGGVKSDVYVEKSLMDQANLPDVKLNPLKKINRGFKSTFGKDANTKDYYRVSTEQLLTSKIPINATEQSVYDDISNQIVSQLKTKASKQVAPVFYNPKTAKSPGSVLRWGLYGLPATTAFGTAFNTTASHIGQWRDYKGMQDRLQDTDYADFQELYYDLPQQDRDNISLIVSNYVNNPYQLENKQQFDALVDAFEQQYGEKGLQMLNAYVKYQSPDYSKPVQIHPIQEVKNFVNDRIYSFETTNDIDNSFAKGGPIHIKKENRGKFTAAANRAGKSVQEYASQILANKDHYSTTLVKRANFARVFGKKK